MEQYCLRYEHGMLTLIVALTFWPLQGKLYIHAGCPESGRLSTLHSFDLSSNRWKSLASAPDPGRGGTGLAAVQMPDQGGTILRFGGKQMTTLFLLNGSQQVLPNKVSLVTN